MKLDIVDVFAERQLAGNQLAVVHDAGGMTTEQMQEVAREMNFSETTFVLDANDERARVRIFTPEWELPFAGHPTVGTAWVLGRTRPAYTLDLGVGPVTVAFDGDLCWMDPPAVDLGAAVDARTAASVIGLSPDQLHPAYPAQLAEVGPRFLLIGVADLAALRAVTVDPAHHAALDDDDGPRRCLFVFTDDAYGDDADFAARMFFDSGGLREDPATGSANSAFAAYLAGHDRQTRRVVVDQGVEMKRPSRLYLDVGAELRVGGKVQPVLSGELSI